MSTDRYILLVDDDPDEHLLFEDALKELPHAPKLKYARDGHHLTQMLLENDVSLPGIIFLDLNMPRMNGFECLQYIRNSSRFKHIPIVVFSTSSQTQAIDRVYEQGANYYVRKPNTFFLLKQAITRVLQIDWTVQDAQPLKEHFVIKV